MCLESVIDRMQAISLQEMDSVKLMNRTDRKYWFSASLLADLLGCVAEDYYILELNEQRNMPYSTIYYDTAQDEMYNNHHRGKLNRYKIRRRNYISSEVSFLEVKFKSNKGRTIKVRQRSDFNNTDFDPQEAEFIRGNSPYASCELKKVLENGFRRLMLVSKGMDERCTIDSQLRFVSEGVEMSLEDLVIVEVKSDGRSKSAIVDALKKMRLKPSGFSKYCVGRSFLDAKLYRNNFKRKHRDIDKKINNPINNLDLWM